MNASLPTSVTSSPSDLTPRDWRASIDLHYAVRPQKTVITRSAHLGPLRVQRPFYPERNGTCHTYLLHPPGGMVIGDHLSISAQLENSAQALITTPSAGKIYGAKGSSHSQRQSVKLNVATGAVLEWLPQETIVFESANGKLDTKVSLTKDAKIIMWDIVRLGRRASGEEFQQGRCEQSIEITRDSRPLFIERNVFEGSDEFMQAKWGMQGASNCGSLLATVTIDRDTIDQWVEELDELSKQDRYTDLGANLWGLTQKDDLFIARFIGNSITLCRAGFEFLWQQLRPFVKGQEAVVPRIWNT